LADIVSLYAEVMHLYLKEDKEFNWQAINFAITTRWSRSGLQRVKKLAWDILETKQESE